MPSRINTADAWFVGIVVACGFITFYSLPDGIPFLGRLTMMVATQFGLGEALQGKESRYQR